MLPSVEHIKHGSEFTAKKLMSWLADVGVITTFIEPGSPWENGYCESFNSRMRDEFLSGELFGNNPSVLTAMLLRSNCSSRYSNLTFINSRSKNSIKPFAKRLKQRILLCFPYPESAQHLQQLFSLRSVISADFHPLISYRLLQVEQKATWAVKPE